MRKRVLVLVRKKVLVLGLHGGLSVFSETTKVLDVYVLHQVGQWLVG